MSATPDTPEFFWLLLHRLGLSAAQARQWLAADPSGNVSKWLATPVAQWPVQRLTDQTLARLRDWQQHGDASEAALEVSADLRWLRSNGTQLLHLADTNYPSLLREIADPPPWLYVRGDVDVLQEPQMAVVGSRKPTATGLADASAFAGELAAAGFVVTSGLAFGVDAAAHRGALASGGRSIAVLGSGLDKVYPAQHRSLADQLGNGGAVLSELPLGTPPRPQQFPSRNRIISGLSLGVLVVEAALRSGSLVTARLALEQNREVFALPGSIHNPASRGCNALIRQGATLVTEVADIVAELGGWLLPQTGDSPPTAAAAQSDSPLLAAIGFEPTPIDLLVDRVALPLPELLVALGDLELDGLVEQRGGAWLRCRPA